jgi:hypothetical protein
MKETKLQYSMLSKIVGPPLAKVYFIFFPFESFGMVLKSKWERGVNACR